MENQSNQLLSLDTNLQTLPFSLYNLPFPIQTFILHCENIFQTPYGLPLPRPHDDNMPFLPNTPPITVRPILLPALSNGDHL